MVETAKGPPACGTIVLTGASGGIGIAILRHLLARSDVEHLHVVCAVRDVANATELRSMKAAGAVSSYEHVSMDLSQLAQVRDVATGINRRVSAGEIPPIRALILNAGYVEFTHQTWTQDGYDMSFASTYLGHWLLTMKLLQSIDPENGRIVVIASSAHDTADPRNQAGGQYVDEKWRPIFHENTDPIAFGTWSTTAEDPSFKGGYRRYGAAKLCQVMMIPELQHRLDKDQKLHKISVLGIDPGSVPTGLTRRGDWRIRGLWKFIMPWLAVPLNWLWPNGTYRTTKKSARDIVAAALECNSTLGQKPKGLYLDGENAIEMSAEAMDPRKRATLWEDTKRYARLTQEETALQHIS